MVEDPRKKMPNFLHKPMPTNQREDQSIIKEISKE